MKKIAIIGVGPTGIYTFLSLLEQNEPFAITFYERGSQAGVGMPYSDEDNSRMMLANIASIEIPPVLSTYIDWLKTQSKSHLARYGVEYDSLHVRQFLPRILLGEYFHDRFIELVALARQQGFHITIKESCEVTDLQASGEGVNVWADGASEAERFDFAVIATGHVWPDKEESTRTFFPSPWSGLMEAKIDAVKVGVLGTSLSGIDAAMAVAAQHGSFVESDDGTLTFRRDKSSESLEIVLMSRSGILPEADFYCPIPYEPLHVVTQEALDREIAAGQPGLLDRVFRLIVEELLLADPRWCEEIALLEQDADSFSETYFARRQRQDPFNWAEINLAEVERNKRDRHTVPWRYAILRLHEAIETIVPHLTEEDRTRFTDGLAKVFIDNYAAIPSQSIRRLLALREAGIVSIMALGHDYEMAARGELTEIEVKGKRYRFDVFIDARGQRPLTINDLPFPSLREQLQVTGEDFPDVGDDYTLQEPPAIRGRIAFGAIPWLMHDRPFVQGLTACAEIGAAMAKAISRPSSHRRRRLPFIEL